MRSQLVLFALSALSAVSAQNFTIDPNEVDITTRSSWCSGEYSTCDTLCDKDATTNDCDPAVLSYNCVCSNGSAPGLQYYSESMPSFICRQAFSDCIDTNAGNAAGQKNCTTTIGDKCGTLDVANYTATPTTTSAGPSSATTEASSSTGAASSGTGASAAATSTSTAAAAPTNIHLIGNGAAAMAVGLFAYLL